MSWDAAGYVIQGVAIAAQVAATGLEVYSAIDSAQTQQRIADYNRKISEQNASIQRNAAIAQAQAAQYNAKVQEQTANLRQQAAENQNKQATEQAARIRQQRDRLLGLQRSQYAAAGVTAQGSPLAVLADTYNQGELAATEERWRGYETARQQNYQADFERETARYDLQNAMWEEKTAGAGYRIAMRKAQIQQAAGYAQARATRMEGYAAALSGMGSFANSGSSFQGKNIPGEFQYYTGTVPKAKPVS